LDDFFVVHWFSFVLLIEEIVTASLATSTNGYCGSVTELHIIPKAAARAAGIEGEAEGATRKF
jgi:hypothetical protein